METVYEVTVVGTHQIEGGRVEETYFIDLEGDARLGNADRYAEEQAKEMAFSDHIAPERVSSRKGGDYVMCPHCDEPISSDQFD